MADYVQVPADSVGKKVDAASLDVGADTVYRQRIVIGDDSATAQFALVTSGCLQVIFSTPPTINNISAAVAVNGSVGISGTAVVAGVVALTAGTAVIGDVNAISRTVQVAVGTPFTLNNISATTIVAGNVNLSATAIVAGVVGLTAGAANIGFINHISATVTVAGNVNLSATANVVVGAGTANIGFINNISATVTVAGNVNISATAVVAGVVALTAGTENIGTLNGISATVTTAVRSIYANLSVPSASRGPRMIIASTSSNVTLVAAPGAGLAVYVTHIAVSNASGSNTRARIGTSASIGLVTMMLAASGGGFVMPMNPPWKLSTNEALVCSVKPNASEGLFNVHFFVASADAL